LWEEGPDREQQREPHLRERIEFYGRTSELDVQR
jgi:hypothetical protein